MWIGKNMILPVLAFLTVGAYANCVDQDFKRTDYKAVGVVKNTDGEVVYEEHHSYSTDQNTVVSKVDYKTPNGELIAEKTLEFDCPVSAPAYVLKMKRGSDWVEAVDLQSDRLVVTKPDGSKTLKLDSTENLVIDAGFDHYIAHNWQALTAGEQRQIDYLYVHGKRLISLVVNVIDANQADDFSISGDLVVFKITTGNKLLRLFAKPIYLGYDKLSKKLAFYSGPTNLHGAIAGLDKSNQIFITYRYN